ncbi:MAG: hypothetical protein Q9201_006117 [Fulgogasparrea decipioides]
MSSAKSTSGFQIPNVTPTDLKDFQCRHFASGFSSTVAGLDESSADQEYPDYGTGGGSGPEEAADDLGYYPDGVKRTLTDEQISMFRHSEIYSLLRKRQLEKENELVEKESSDLSPGSEPPRKPSVSGSDKEVDEHQSSPATDGTYRTSNPAVKKRKLGHDAQKSAHNTAPSSRRQARELDCVFEDVGFLDYDDEPAVKQEEEATRRTQVNYGDLESTDEPAASPDPGLSKQGRKIWWPTIG